MTLHHTDDKECPLCESKLLTAHYYLRNWFHEIKAKYPNVHISWAYRGKDDQEKAFNEGKTKCHFPNSPHNHEENCHTCSLALDLFLLDEDFCARFPSLWYAKLNAENKANRLPICWGGDFKHLGDFDHFEVVVKALS